MQESLKETIVDRYRLKNSVDVETIGEGQGVASEFTNLVLSYSDKIERMVAENLELEKKRELDRRLEEYVSMMK